MDLILVLLVSRVDPTGVGLHASELSEPSARSPRDVRASLTRLQGAGLAESYVAGSRGPVGTFRWRPTEAGVEAARRAIEWVRS